MSTTLTYFNFDGSRGLECRLALCVAGVDFEDIRVSGDEWRALKPTLPYGALPLLTEGGRRLAQSMAILRYIGGTYGLHPTDPWTAAEHDALMLSVEDLRYKLPGGQDTPDAEKKAAREAFTDGWLRQWAETVSARIVGPFIEGEAMNVADIKLYVILRSLLGGTYDHIPASVFKDSPQLLALVAAVEAQPAVRAYLQSR